MGGARLQDLATKLAVEGFMTFEHQDVGATLGQQQAKHQSGRATADNTGVDSNRVHNANVTPLRITPGRREGNS